MRRSITRLAIALVVVLMALVVYGSAVEPRLRLDESHHQVAIPGLPDELAGTTVAVFADLQVGMWWANHRMVARIVDRTVALEPDAVLIAGDFVYGPSPDAAAQVQMVVDLLAPLAAHDVPTFAVLGNHDHAAGTVRPLTEALEQHGVEVLHNRAVRLDLAGSAASDLHVVGLGAHRRQQSRPDEALAQVPTSAPRVVMMHNPASYPEIDEGGAPLAVAGHTHCGQISLPGTPAWSYLFLREEERVVVDGFAPEGYGAPGNRLFVTCGVGFSFVPVRISAPPQLAVFELVPGTP